MCDVEIWRSTVEKPDDYEVSSRGRVRNKNRMNVLTPQLNYNGYYRLFLGRGRCYYIHRLVLGAFVGYPSDERIVCNHISGIKTDNNIRNLEWNSMSENLQHAYDMNLRKVKSVIRISSSGQMVKYKSLKEAAAANNTHPPNICGALKGKHKTSVGYAWRYDV
jgi:NUMOD4 motif/HNH endonuclease